MDPRHLYLPQRMHVIQSTGASEREPSELEVRRIGEYVNIVEVGGQRVPDADERVLVRHRIDTGYGEIDVLIPSRVLGATEGVIVVVPLALTIVRFLGGKRREFPLNQVRTFMGDALYGHVFRFAGFDISSRQPETLVISTQDPCMAEVIG